MLLRSSCALCGVCGPVVCRPCETALSPAASLPAPHGLDGCWAALGYDDARAIVTALKNGGRRDVVRWLSARMAEQATPPPATLVTWAPTSLARARSRGFDHAELLARSLARRWGLPCRGLLVRRPGPPQAGRAASERRGNPVFRARRGVPEVVVVVDDVVTTGATMAAAARALRTGGAERVLGAVAVRARPRR